MQKISLLRVIVLIFVAIFFFIAYGYGLEFDNSARTKVYIEKV